VVIDPEELDKVRAPADKTVNIDAFVPTDAIDPICLSGKGPLPGAQWQGR
jgi:non-homologous end joining protein Ku